MQTEQQNPLATQKVSSLILKFTIPAIISMMVSSLYNIVDQIFIGQGVGMLGNAATNIAFPVNIICTAVALLLGIGSASNFNLKSGAGQTEVAKNYAGNGLTMLVVCGVIITAVTLGFLTPLMHIFGATEEVLPYAIDYTGITAIGVPFLILTTGGCHLVRADRSPSFSMACMLTGAIINTILDPLFIFAFHWGIKGAAWATVLGQVVSGVMILIYFWKFSKMQLTRHHLMPHMKYLGEITALGMASGINQVAMAIIQITMNNILRKYGAVSDYGADIPIACAGIISKVNMIFMSIGIGISQGCQPIFGFNYGAEKFDRVRETYKKAAWAAIISGIVFFACFQIFPRQIIALFGGGNEAYYRFAERYFRIFMFMTFINGIQPMSSGFFTSIGKAKLGMIVSLTRQILFLLPLILILPVFMGIDGVMYAGPIADLAAAVITIWFVFRQFQDMKQKESESGSHLSRAL
ncbi:MATE family efflux transporter [Eubacterium ramulus]|uniref:Multidrug export protein MepA n=1 Tax=Eubacterium ramulus ATCC 29099 TaxID=1256908 RepID=U2RA58_EUBRA|nr:MATE family efflux transporter [Eubacterium ramulus]ERK50458.1 MATE efflux family protein [Eubacterium ramulus ATCC 29099]